MSEKKIFGLIGYPLSHSFSQKFFTEKFTRENLPFEYRNFELESIETLPELLEKERQIHGLNVTIPHKISALTILTKVDEIASKIGSVNTIKIKRTQDKTERIGYNTDYIGFLNALKPLLKSNQNRALILGNGGSSKAVQYALSSLGITYLIVCRYPKNQNEIGWNDLTENHILFHPLLINTTPLGMYPSIENSPPIPYENITKEHLLFDLIYNPEETVFMKKGKEKGAMVSNGLTMLHQQAIESWKIWNS